MTTQDLNAVPAHGSEEEPALSLIYTIGRYDLALRAELKRRLRPLGLTLSEFTTLSVLRARGGLSNAQLARRSMVTPQAMNQVLASLEEKGLVRRQAAPGQDARGHHRARGATLTAEGARRIRQCDAVVQEIEDLSFATIAPAERAALASLLRAGTERLRRGQISVSEL